MSALSDSFYKGLLERHPLFYSIFVIHEYSSELGVYDGAQAWGVSWDDRMVWRRAGLPIVASLIYVLYRYLCTFLYVSI